MLRDVSMKRRSPTLTHIHHVVVHAVDSRHLHEAVGIASLLQSLWQVGVVPVQVVEELQERMKPTSESQIILEKVKRWLAVNLKKQNKKN